VLGDDLVGQLHGGFRDWLAEIEIHEVEPAGPPIPPVCVSPRPAGPRALRAPSVPANAVVPGDRQHGIHVDRFGGDGFGPPKAARIATTAASRAMLDRTLTAAGATPPG